MIEDNKNNDTKEELEKSSDSNDMDIQNVDNSKDLENTKIDQKTEDSNDQLNVDKSKDLENTKIDQKTEDSNVQLKEDQEENSKEDQEENSKEDQDLKSEENQDKKLDEDHPDAKWYIVSAHSGFEEKAIETIKKNAKKASLAKLFCDFKIPTHEVIEVKKGKKINTEKKFFPGYMLIKMLMNNETWQLVKKSDKVSGFVGNDHKPTPLTDLEAKKMLKKGDDSVEYIAPKLTYEVGEEVKVSDGPFASFKGMVEEIDEERGRLKVSVSIFGRSTPVELEYTQVEKV